MKRFALVSVVLAITITMFVVTMTAEARGLRGGGQGCNISSGSGSSQGCNIQRSAPISVVAPAAAAPVSLQTQQPQTSFLKAPAKHVQQRDSGYDDDDDQPEVIVKVDRKAAISFCQPTEAEVQGRVLLAFSK